jgi:hypothetical protein
VKKAGGRRDTRRFDRKARVLPVTVRTAADRISAGISLDSTDLSEGGAFLRSDLLFDVGETIELEIPVSSRALRTLARVVRVAREGGGTAPYGMGIEFVKLAQTDRRALAASFADLQRRGAPPGATARPRSDRS